MNMIIKKLFIFCIGLFLAPQAFAVTVNITSDLPTLAVTHYNLGVFIENKYMVASGNIRSAGIFNEEKITTHLYSSPIGGSETYIDIFHDSQHPASTFCILDVNLDQETSMINDVSWIKNEPWHPEPIDRTKPAKCSYAISGQTINVYINYTGEPQ